jgi:DNA invertase Pin-like site-specific DNA recombinase
MKQPQSGLQAIDLAAEKTGRILKQMKIAIYNRVSTGKQDPLNQADQLREFASRQSWSITHDFTDVVSGSKSERDRPQFRKLMEAASKREFDMVLFWALDRFSREGVLPTLQHLQRLDAYGIGWRSYTEQYLDSTGVFKDAVISIMATIAKQENIRRSERIVAGLQRAKRNGSRLGRPQVANAKASRTTLWRRATRKN